MSEETTQNLPNNDLKLILGHLGSIDARFTTLENRFTTLEDRFTALEDKVDRRLQETRPIWEQVLARFDNLETRLDTLGDEMRNGFRKLERQVGLLAEDVLIVRADQRDLEKRVGKLESEPAQ